MGFSRRWEMDVSGDAQIQIASNVRADNQAEGEGGAIVLPNRTAKQRVHYGYVSRVYGYERQLRSALVPGEVRLLTLLTLQ
jgi:hypothetical protein